MASDIGWGGLPFMVPSKTAMHYIMHAHSIIPEEEIAAGAHYRARQDMLDNVSITFFMLNNLLFFFKILFNDHS